VQIDNSSVVCGCGISAGGRRDGRYGGGRRCRCKKDEVVVETIQSATMVVRCLAIVTVANDTNIDSSMYQLNYGSA